MAHTSGYVSRFAETDISGESMATADGIDLVYIINTNNPGIDLDSFVVHYTIGGTPYQGDADSNGDITGPNISSGTVNFDGTMNVTFTSPPDDQTLITCDYTIVGLLTKIRDFIKGNSNSVQIGTGDGVQTIFAGTYPDTPMKSGSTKLEFTYLGCLYQIYDNADGAFDHRLVASSSLNQLDGSVSVELTVAPDDTTSVIVTSVTGADGQDWEEYFYQPARKSNGYQLAYDTEPQYKEGFYRNAGKDGKSPIYMAIRSSHYLNSNYEIQTRASNYLDRMVSKDLGNNIGWINDTNQWEIGYDATRNYWSGLPKLAVNNDILYYWLYSNRARIVLVVKVAGTYYNMLYCGSVEKEGSKGGPFTPCLTFGGAYSTWNYDHGSIRSIMTMNDSYCKFQNEFGWRIPEWRYGDRNLQTTPSNWNDFSPYNNPPSGETIINPLILGVTEWDGMNYRIDGVFHVMTESIQPEDYVVKGGDKYKVFLDVNLSRYFAVKEE